MPVLNVRLPAERIEALNVAARERGMSRSEFVRAALDAALHDLPAPEEPPKPVRRVGSTPLALAVRTCRHPTYRLVRVNGVLARECTACGVRMT